MFITLSNVKVIQFYLINKIDFKLYNKKIKI